MSETRHTPGPWVLADWDSDDREALIKMECTAPDEWHWAGWVRTRTIENASLICAAPLLLQACKAVVEAFGCPGGDCGGDGQGCCLCKTRAAIAAAEKGGGR